MFQKCVQLIKQAKKRASIWVWVNTYRHIFSGMNIHLPAILGFTRYQGFDPSPFGMLLQNSVVKYIGFSDGAPAFFGAGVLGFRLITGCFLRRTVFRDTVSNIGIQNLVFFFQDFVWTNFGQLFDL